MKAAATWEHVSTIRPDPDNPVIHTPEEVEELRALIADTVWTDPIVCRRADRQIIAGHRRLSAALLAVEGDPAWQLSDAPKPGTVPVRFVNVTPEQARRLLLADNAMTKQSAWDEEVLGRLLREMDSADIVGIGFDEDELRRLIDAGDAQPKPPASDDAPEVQQGPADSQPGQVYELGAHRLVCGDSTKPETWALVSDDVAGIYTDPPYGISYSGKGITAGGVKGNDFGRIMGDDDTTAARGAFAVSRSDQSRPEVWWGAHYYADAMPPGRAWLVWDKVVIGDVYSAAELAWTSGTGRTRMFRHQWHGMVRASEHGAKVHPTQKPVAMAVWAFEQLGFGPVVADLFGGSGSTLIACAETGRVARCIELDPGYCDVIRRRWTRYARERNLDPGTGALDG